VTARTPSAAAALPTARRSARLLSALTFALVLAGMSLAAPAAAVDDPGKPGARVTHGPSCHPGGVVVEVTGGTVDYAVTFATTRTPGGEDSATVPAGTTVELRTGNVAWGETIDGRLEFEALDGSGTAFVDELEGYTFTRPSEEDCAAIAAPAAAATVPPVVPGTSGAASPADDTAFPAAGGKRDPGTVADAGSAVGADGVRPDGSRPGGTDAAGGTATPAPGKVEVAGTAARVELVEAAASPSALPRATSLAPLLAAAVALGASGAGLAGAFGRSRRAGRKPPESA
jgi:hypothetical protein